MRCCRRSPSHIAPTDFCSNLNISTAVSLSQNGSSWAINIDTGPHTGNLESKIASCASRKSAGVKLAQVSVYALHKAISQGKQDALKEKTGRRMPLVLIKDFLFKLVGACTSCRGRGCSACNGMGV